MMDPEWNDRQPIYWQLRDRIVEMILDGVLNEGDPLPSISQQNLGKISEAAEAVAAQQQLLVLG